ncbi:FG-GAP repeat domain-containing protein [Nocardia sp. NPDC049149]|uniref:FG-GAP repeat domain-containing protein n=1 Tax=Nocardia sp. NPDC049149 TaxID=3364315 RepID=UPI0037138DE9
MRITRWFAAAVLVAGSAGSVASAAPPTGSWSEPGQAPIFRESVQYPVGSAGQGLGSQTIAAGDFDHDGNADVAAVDTAGGVAISRGDGSGQLRRTQYVATDLGANAVQAADLRGTGNLDLVVTNLASISVLFNDGNGNFAVDHTYSTDPNPTVTARTGGLPFGVAIADFNHTGHPGLAINNVLPVPGGVGIMDNDGSGHFAPPRWFGAGLLKLGIQAGDLTGDGWPSLVVEDRATSGAWVMLNDHHGGFLPPRWHLILLPDEDIKLSDVDGNGTLDLVTANIAAFSFSVHYGNGDGTFGPPTPTFGPVGPCAVEPGDYTGHHNGLQDIAVVQFVPSVVQIWRNNGDHTFSYLEQHTIGLGGQAAHAVPLNRDRLPDLVTASTFSADVAVLVNNNPA